MLETLSSGVLAHNRSQEVECEDIVFVPVREGLLDAWSDLGATQGQHIPIMAECRCNT